MAGKDHLVAGSPEHTAQVVAAKVLPDRAMAEVHAQMSKPRGG